MGGVFDVSAGILFSLIGLFMPPQPVAASHVRIPPAQTRITPRVIRTLIPTSAPTPTTTPLPTPIPPTKTPSPVIHDWKTEILSAINAYRVSKGIAWATPDFHTCSFAAIRAKEIASDFSHSGFQQRQQTKTLPYPSYSLVTENIAYTRDYRSVVSLWINSPGHASNMERDTPHICVERFGDYFAYEGWKP